MDLSYESLAGDPVFGAEFDHNLEAIATRPNHVAIASMLVPEGTECSTPRDWWGVGLDLWAGRRCWFEDIQRNGELVTARVFGRVDGATVPVTSGVVHLSAWPQDAPELTAVSDGVILPDGTARVILTPETMHAIADWPRVIGVLARPGDVNFGQAISDPIVLS